MAEKFTYQSPYVYAANNPIRYIDVLGLYAGESGSWESGDDDFDEVLAYWGISSNNDDNSSEEDTDDVSRLKEKAKTDPWGTAGEFYGMAASITGGGFVAAMDGRDPLNPTQADEDEAGTAFMMGVTAIIALPGGGGVLVGKVVLKGGKWVFQNAPRAYKTTQLAVNYLGDVGMKSYIILESNIKAQTIVGVGQGLLEAHFNIPPYAVDHPFVVTKMSADLTNSLYFFFNSKPAVNE